MSVLKNIPPNGLPLFCSSKEFYHKCLVSCSPKLPDERSRSDILKIRSADTLDPCIGFSLPTSKVPSSVGITDEGLQLRT